MVNPLSGDTLDTMDKILDFMIGVELPQFQFYSSSVSVLDVNNVTIPSGILVQIVNCNNSTFRVSYIANPMKFYNVYGSSGARTQTELTI